MKNTLLTIIAALSFAGMAHAQMDELSPLVVKNYGQDKSFRAGLRLPVFSVKRVTLDGWVLNDFSNGNSPSYFGGGLGVPLWSNDDVRAGLSVGWSGHPETLFKWRGGEFSFGGYLSFKL